MNISTKLARQIREGLIILFAVLLFVAVVLLAKQYYPGGDYYNLDKAPSMGEVLPPKHDIPATKSDLRVEPVDTPENLK